MYTQMCFFFNDTATTEIYTLSLHDALPILDDELVAGEAAAEVRLELEAVDEGEVHLVAVGLPPALAATLGRVHGEVGLGQQLRSEEHTSELQSRQYLVCRILLEKKKLTRDVHSNVFFF